MKSIFFVCAVMFLVSSSFAKQKKNCQSHLGVIYHGDSATGYTTAVSMPGFPCVNSKVTVLCLDGILQGPDLYPACSDVLQDCQGVPNGGSVTGFQSSFAPCISSTVTCSNGALSGPLPAPSCTE